MVTIQCGRQASVLVRLAMVILAAHLLELTLLRAAPASVAFLESAAAVEAYDFFEVTVTVAQPDAKNPFTDVSVTGEFTGDRGGPLRADGFCDSADGTTFRVRFMPVAAGPYRYSVRYRQGDFERVHTGSFRAENARRRGQLRVDPAHPEHFIWAGTGEHYFWNGTTTYYLMGWEDDAVIRSAIDRLAGLKINRLRVLVYGRNLDRPWGQPVKTTPEFKLYLNPWPAARPDDVKNPGFDLARFNVPFWQKYERMLRHARDRDVIVSVIFFIGGQELPTPFAAYSEDEKRFYRYGVARLGAFSNITWDLGNEHNFHREVPKWCDWLGPLVKDWDPYDHLTSAHNVIYRTPGAVWNDLQLIQRWDTGQNAYLLGERAKQSATGRPIPQVNEEYGYEDLWENRPGERSAETRRQLAWEISMAGCYQTTGETANRGVGFPPDTGGGWVSGRGDDSMTMLHGYAHMVDFFAGFSWWQCAPSNGLVSGGAVCLAQPGRVYALYAPAGSGVLSLKLAEGRYQARRFNPRSGEWKTLPPAASPVWSAAAPPEGGDWAYFFQRDDQQADTTAPRPLIAQAVSRQSQVMVQFSEAVDPASATNPAHYRLAPEREILSAQMHSEEPNLVILRTAPLQLGAHYTLAVKSISDRATPPNSMREGAELAFEVIDPSQPLVELRFDEVTGQNTPNTGSTAKAAPHAVLTKDRPRKTTQTPSESGTALDFGRAHGEFAVELAADQLDALKGLKSFTISGWANCRDATIGPGGNRLVTTVNQGGDGFDLVFLRDGRLQLSVNQWPDNLPTQSAPAQISVDPDAGPDNWRFFAVTYDSTAASEQVRFYFGKKDTEAAPNTAITYPRGPVGQMIGPLAVGHFNRTTRGGNGDRMFRGLLDEIRIHGSQVDGAGALTLPEIRAVQKRGAAR